MRNIYDDFIQQKPKEMSKTMSDMAFKYINPETHQPTKIPATHFEKELGQAVERTIAQATNRQFLTIMFNQLNALKKEDEKYFYQALICIDNNLNPKDLRIPEQIALNHTYEYLEQKQKTEKKEFHFLDEEISNEYDRAMYDPAIQKDAVELSNFIEAMESRELDIIKEQDLNNASNNINNQDNISRDIEDEYERDY